MAQESTSEISVSRPKSSVRSSASCTPGGQAGVILVISDFPEPRAAAGEKRDRAGDRPRFQFQEVDPCLSFRRQGRNRGSQKPVGRRLRSSDTTRSSLPAAGLERKISLDRGSYFRPLSYAPANENAQPAEPTALAPQLFQTAAGDRRQ